MKVEFELPDDISDELFVAKVKEMMFYTKSAIVDLTSLDELQPYQIKDLTYDINLYAALKTVLQYTSIPNELAGIEEEIWNESKRLD